MDDRTDNERSEPSADEHELEVWLQTFEPCVDVEIEPDKVVMRSARPTIARLEVEVPRSSDLHMDLETALRRLVIVSS